MATKFDSHENVVADAELKVSPYDKVASLLIALLIVVSFFVLLLLGIWLTGHVRIAKEPPPIERLDDKGRGDHAPGFALDAEEPGMEEMEELKEPQIEDALPTFADVVTNRLAVFDAIENAADISSRGDGWGDKRPPGDVWKPLDPDVIPRYERWEIRFSTKGIETYARQLDFFKIEIGAVGGGSNKVDYACNVTKSKPDRRSGKPDDEKRLYMCWQKDGPMSAFDRQLLKRTGIETQRRLILQFYPKGTEELLSHLEAQAARDCGHTDPRSFVKTVFGVRPVADGYEFYLIDQYFRPAPKP